MSPNENPIWFVPRYKIDFYLPLFPRCHLVVMKRRCGGKLREHDGFYCAATGDYSPNGRCQGLYHGKRYPAKPLRQRKPMSFSKLLKAVGVKRAN